MGDPVESRDACPFCGEEGTDIEIDDTSAQVVQKSVIEGQCGSRGPMVKLPEEASEEEKKAAAISAWRKRIPS